MQYKELKPFVQDSFGFNIPEPTDIVIPARNTRQGILYFQSQIPSFKQTGAPAHVSREKIYQRTGKQPFKVIYNTLHFPGEYIDEYADTIAYCPCCHRNLVENGTIIKECMQTMFW
jgi:hypothetical protein